MFCDVKFCSVAIISRRFEVSQNLQLQGQTVGEGFYILLTMHHVMILAK